MQIIYKFLQNSSENYLGLSFLSFVMEFRELSDEEWEVIRPLFPLGRRGKEKRK